MRSRRSLKPAANKELRLRVHLLPCSCGTTLRFRMITTTKGTAWNRYLTCPNCGKRHDPKNRLLQVGFHREGYWKVDECCADCEPFLSIKPSPSTNLLYFCPHLTVRQLRFRFSGKPLQLPASPPN